MSSNWIKWLPLATFRLGIVDNFSVLRTLKDDLKIILVSSEKVKIVDKQYNSKGRYTSKAWLIKRRKQSLKSPKFQTRNGLPNW
jgi:hypothetical protein